MTPMILRRRRQDADSVGKSKTQGATLKGRRFATDLRTTLASLLGVNFSTPAHAPIPRVKNPDMLLRIVVLLTLVYPRDAFIAQLAPNLHYNANQKPRRKVERIATHQSPQKASARAAV